jgi:integrase
MRDHTADLHHGRKLATEDRGTLGEHLADWLADIESAARRGGRKPTTAAFYRSIVNGYLVPQLGHVALAKLTPADIVRAWARLEQAGGRKGRGLSATTVRHCHGALAKALTAAVRAGKLTASPVDRMTDEQRPVKVKRSRDQEEARRWTTDEAARFAAVAIGAGTAEALALAVMLRTGLRRGEALDLRWRDLTEVERPDGRRVGQLTVRRSRVMVAGEVQTSTPKTAAGVRTVPVDPEALGLFDHARRLQAADRLRAGEGSAGPQAGDGDGAVFRYPESAARDVFASETSSSGYASR